MLNRIESKFGDSPLKNLILNYIYASKHKTEMSKLIDISGCEGIYNAEMTQTYTPPKADTIRRATTRTDIIYKNVINNEQTTTKPKNSIIFTNNTLGVENYDNIYLVPNGINLIELLKKEEYIKSKVCCVNNRAIYVKKDNILIISLYNGVNVIEANQILAITNMFKNKLFIPFGNALYKPIEYLLDKFEETIKNQSTQILKNKIKDCESYINSLISDIRAYQQEINNYNMQIHSNEYVTTKQIIEKIKKTVELRKDIIKTYDIDCVTEVTNPVTGMKDPFIILKIITKNIKQIYTDTETLRKTYKNMLPYQMYPIVEKLIDGTASLVLGQHEIVIIITPISIRNNTKILYPFFRSTEVNRNFHACDYGQTDSIKNKTYARGCLGSFKVPIQLQGASIENIDKMINIVITYLQTTATTGDVAGRENLKNGFYIDNETNEYIYPETMKGKLWNTES